MAKTKLARPKIKAPSRALRNSARHFRPSEEERAFFIQVHARKVKYPSHAERSGKWLVFVDRRDVDDVWQKIYAALIAGKLGSHAKVSTARPNPNSTNPNKHVICVYTYDSEDRKDVMRIRDSLRELGLVSPIAYKTDVATDEGQYKVRGHRRISKYYE
jgi:hypothetical protein